MEPGAGWKRETPVVFFIFKRPDTTERVFQAIREARPKKLLIIADGPRQDRPGEKEACQRAREIVEKIDWDCEVLRNYSDVNLGCNERIVSGLNWTFSQVEEAIILEDDCLPAPSFFRFCEEMLERYRDVPSVFSVCGAVSVPMSERNSYYFSAYFACHGWGAWKRAWNHFPGTELESLREAFSGNHMKMAIEETFSVGRVKRHVRQALRLILRGRYVSWDYSWSFWCLKNKALCVVSARNLVVNIGVGIGTHSSGIFLSPSAPERLDRLDFPLIHPSLVARDEPRDMALDRFVAPFFNYSFVYSLILWMKIIVPVSFHAGLKTYSTKVMAFFAKFYQRG